MDEFTAFDKVWYLQALSWVNLAAWFALAIAFVPKLARANGQSVLITTMLYIAIAQVIMSLAFLSSALEADVILADTAPRLMAVFAPRVICLTVCLMCTRMLYVVSRHRVKVLIVDHNIPSPEEESIHG